MKTRLFDEEGNSVPLNIQGNKRIARIMEEVRGLLAEGYHPRDLENWLMGDITCEILASIVYRKPS